MAWTSKAPGVDADAVVCADTSQMWQDVEVVDTTSEAVLCGSTLQEVFDVEVIDVTPEAVVCGDTAQDWQDVEVAANSPEIGIAPPVDSTPYIDLTRIDPEDGDTDVLPSASMLIPACDIVPETEIRSDLLTFGTDYYAVQTQGVNDSNVVIKVDQGSGFDVVYQNGSAQGGWSVGKSANDDNGYDYTVTPPSAFPEETVITVKVETYDAANNFDCYTYSFETGSIDFNPPYVTNRIPQPNATGVDKDQALSFSIADDVSGVDKATIRIYVRGLLVYSGATDDFTDGWRNAAVTENAALKGYDLIFRPDRMYRWVDGEPVWVRAIADDFKSNHMDESWVFTAGDRPYDVRVFKMMVGSVQDTDEK